MSSSIKSPMIASLQNRQISGASAIHERALAKRENKREVWGEKNPPVVTPLFMLYRPLEMIDMDLQRRTNHKTIQCIGVKEMSQVTGVAAKAAALSDNEFAVNICNYVILNSNKSVW